MRSFLALIALVVECIGWYVVFATPHLMPGLTLIVVAAAAYFLARDSRED